jgi:L-aminopeptidase/D-esterase-like protein
MIIMTQHNIKSNDQMKLEPVTNHREPTLEFDFPELRIGIGEYKEGPTGCTVFRFEKKIKMITDVRGGAPGVVGANLGEIDAITFAGGSLFGFESFSGVRAELLKEQNFSFDWGSIPLDAGAVIWDFVDRPDNVIYPDKALGRAAFCAAKRNIFPLGNQGAGVSATVGKFLGSSYREKGGQGGGYHQFGEVKILVFSVVNSLGAIQDRGGEIVRGHFDQEKSTHFDVSERIKDYTPSIDQTYQGNTTLTLVITNQRFESRYIMGQVARQIHVSMARVIHPFHHLMDGDVLFLTTTEAVHDEQLTPGAFGVLAGELVWDAVLACFE